MAPSPFRFPDDVPVLSDGEVTLRPHRADDIPRIVELANDERSQRFIPGLPTPYGMQQGQEFVDSRPQSWAQEPVHPVWAIETGGRFAGSINLHPRADRVWEAGYSTHPDARGQGLASRALRLVVEHAFEALDAQTVAWRCGGGNFASWRVAWSAGFRFDGVWRGMHPGSFGPLDDAWQGSLQRDEWRASRSRPHRAARPWWEPTLLRGGRVVLRPFQDGDQLPEAPDAVAGRFAADLQPALEEYPTWLRERRRRMATGGDVYWCIADPVTDRLLGEVCIQHIGAGVSAGTGSLGYWLIPDARGRGLVTDALELVIPHAFAPLTDLAGAGGLGLHRLFAGTDERNRASQRVLRRAGFLECARERGVLTGRDGSHTGAISFELLATDDRDAQRVAPLTVPTLQTERLRLREWRESDRPTARHTSDPDAEAFMATFLPTSATFDSALLRRRQLADTGKALIWCIADRETDEMLGNIGLFDLHGGTRGNAEIGYWLWQQERGRGLSAEAVKAVVTWALGDGGFTRLHAETDLRNLASQKVLIRNGFREWGRDRAAYTSANGEVTDGVYFELLAEENPLRTTRAAGE